MTRGTAGAGPRGDHGEERAIRGDSQEESAAPDLWVEEIIHFSERIIDEVDPLLSDFNGHQDQADLDEAMKGEWRHGR
jgi:hypothetical protein